jgi:hypothetical protein
MNNTNYKVDNFIMEWENFMDKKQCDDYIQSFERAKDSGFTVNRFNSHSLKRHHVDDTQLYSQDVIEANKMLGVDDLTYESFSKIFRSFMEKFWTEAYSEYANKYSYILDTKKHAIRLLKIQKTEVGGGYHSWHTENTSLDMSARLLTFTLYLNDIGDGGETEFLYYPKRIKPKTGKLVMWPAGFTHTHRGNPPLDGTKYILTGWIEYIE